MISAVASAPSITGMRTSMRTTSGSRSRHCSWASSPFAASPTTSMSAYVDSSTLRPSRTIWWSSTMSTRISSFSLTHPFFPLRASS